MGGIINDLQPMLVRDLFDPVYIAHIAVNMNRQDRAGLRRDQAFDFCYVDGVIHIVNVTEHWYESISHNRMGRGCECKRRGDDFTAYRQIHGYNHILEC